MIYQLLFLTAARFRAVTLSEQQQTQLIAMAETCPLLGGEAVLKARSLLTLLEHNSYDDKALCDDVNMVWLRTERTKPNLFMVTPNPATDFATVNFEKGMANATLELIDSKGQPLQSYDIPQDTRNIEIALTKLPSGVYALRLVSLNGVTETLKLVVLKI